MSKGTPRRVATALCLTTVLLLTAVSASGCYEYVAPASGVAPAHGQDVRVTLSPHGADAVAATIGPNVAYLDGTLVRASGAAMTVSVSSVRLRNGTDHHWSGATEVSLTQPMIAGVGVRALSRSRTRLAAVGGGLGLAVLFKLVLAASGAAGGGDAGATPPPP